MRIVVGPVFFPLLPPYSFCTQRQPSHCAPAYIFLLALGLMLPRCPNCLSLQTRRGDVISIMTLDDSFGATDPFSGVGGKHPLLDRSSPSLASFSDVRGRGSDTDPAGHDMYSRSSPSRFTTFALADLSLHVKQGGSFRTLFHIGTFMPIPALIERSTSTSCSIRIGMPPGSVPAQVNSRFHSLRRRLSSLFSLPQLRLRPPHRPFHIFLRWHRARTPRYHHPSPRSHVGVRSRMPMSCGFSHTI